MNCKSYDELRNNIINLITRHKFNLLISGTEELDEMKKTRKLQLPKSELHKESKKKPQKGHTKLNLILQLLKPY